MVRPERFELPACCSGGNRSIQLSYGRVRNEYSLHGQGKGINVNHVNSAMLGGQRRKQRDDLGRPSPWLLQRTRWQSIREGSARVRDGVLAGRGSIILLNSEGWSPRQ
jgi:hypothetical protein